MQGKENCEHLVSTIDQIPSNKVTGFLSKKKLNFNKFDYRLGLHQRHLKFFEKFESNQRHFTQVQTFYGLHAFHIYNAYTIYGKLNFYKKYNLLLVMADFLDSKIMNKTANGTLDINLDELESDIFNKKFNIITNNNLDNLNKTFNITKYSNLDEGLR